MTQPPVYFDYLNRFDIEDLALTDAEILAAIEDSLSMQGRGDTEIEPRTHIRPRAGVEGHFNVLRGWIGGQIDSAGVKVVGDFVDNYKDGRPSEYGLLTLFDPRNGALKALVDATGITEMRTGAITALGAKYLAPKNPKVLAHIGARGTAYWNIRLLCHLFDFEEVRVHSRRPESREAFAAKLESLVNDPSGLPAMATAARDRVQSHFLWSQKARQVRQVYDWALNSETAQKPQFFDQT